MLRLRLLPNLPARADPTLPRHRGRPSTLADHSGAQRKHGGAQGCTSTPILEFCLSNGLRDDPEAGTVDGQKNERIFHKRISPAPLHFRVEAQRGTPEIGQNKRKGGFDFFQLIPATLKCGGKGVQMVGQGCPFIFLSIYCLGPHVQFAFFLDAAILTEGQPSEDGSIWALAFC